MPEGQRRLAAIMFTDMVGYTSLSQKNETLAVQLLNEHRNILRPFFPNHGGREVKTLGDGFLVEFASALEAVRCAFNIQEHLHELNSTRPEDRKVNLRIGVHLGDVMQSGEDVYGDAVNIASRIEPLAKPGGICITEQVQQQVRNKFEFPITSLGMKALKNVDQPVNVYEIVLPWEKLEPENAVPSRPQLAVLPFANMSPDPQDEFFADGLTEEMIMELSEISGMGVIARTSVMRYKTTERSVKEICRELGVGYVLEGSVRKAGNKIRVAAQLVDRNELHVWAQRYDRELSDVFDVQSEIAGKVAGSLELKLLPKDSVSVKPAPNLDAYMICMRARILNERRNREANEQAIALYNRALKLDPNNARATAGLADCYRVAWDWRFMDAALARAKTRELALRAVELDRSLSEPHATLGVLLDWERDWHGAQVEYERAIAFNPNYATAHQWYGNHLLSIGRISEGLQELLKASELDPLSAVIKHNLAMGYYLAGKPEDAIWEHSKVIKIEPGIAQSHLFRGYYQAEVGRKEEALADWATYYDLTKDEYEYTLSKAYGEALWGSKEKALQLAEHAISILDKTPPQFSSSPYWLFAYLNDPDQFFKWLDWAIEKEQPPSPGWLLNEPYFQKMREDPRFMDVLKRLNFPASNKITTPNPPA